MKRVLEAVIMGSVCLMFCWKVALAQPVYVDLSSSFDTDVVLEAGGTGIGDPIDADRGRVDGNTLPTFYIDGQPVATQDGSTAFQFASLQQESLDAVAVDGQQVAIPRGNYSSIDLALLSAPGSFGDPFSTIEFRYGDGTMESKRVGPVAGWFASPTAFENTYYRFTDNSNVESLFSFDTDFGDDDLFNLLQDRGNGNAGGNRFVDGTGYALYVFDIPPEITEATLGVTVGNNFVISVATEYWDPDVSTTEGYEVLANSMELYNGFEHRALANLKLYEFDLAPFLARKTGELFLLFTDASPENGWGPFIQNISIFTGKTRTFEEDLTPQVDTSQAEVYAAFRTDGSEEEKPYLYNNSGSGPSNRGHRFADASGSIVYRFDLPDTVDDAKLTVDMANNFVVSLAGPTDVVRYAQVTPGTSDEFSFLLEEGGSILGSNFRFADASAFMVYQFDLPDDLTTAFALVSVGNQFVLDVASGMDGAFQTVRDWVAETGEEPRDLSNLDTYAVDLSPYLQNNQGNIIRLRLSDGQPADGWGPYLTGITLVNQVETGEDDFQVVLNAMEMFGEDIHNEYNKDYYTIDLASILQNNPSKEFFVKFTDGSSFDGWGPGLFWMAVYSGEILIQSDRYVFPDLKATNGEPANYGVGLLHRRYTLPPEKTLQSIVLPSPSPAESNELYLLAATLNTAGTSVQDWMILR